MVKLRPLRWYDRIKTDPSPADPELLSLTREISMEVGSKFWYRQIAWGRFRHGGVGGLISMPVMSREMLLGPVGILSADLMLPEYLKGKLSIDEWRILIGMHLLRLKGHESGAMTRMMGGVSLIVFGTWIPILVLSHVFLGHSIGQILDFSGLGLGGLLALFWARRRIRPFEFQFDRQAATKFGTEQVLHLLEKVKGLQPELPRSIADRVSDYWTPSYVDRIERLKQPEIVKLPRQSRIPKVGLRTRVLIALAGLAIYVTPGFLAARLFSTTGQTMIACANQACIALLLTSFLGFLLIITGSIGTIQAIARRVRQARWNKKSLA